ncbi:DinB family protein [Desulfovibrio aminophilus]|uniref:DinB family protein n=2 Tax=Desulfovibrio aminophilus TaxID=81425 RepID=UPI0003FDAEB0|nr:DinB family protein [Desulfovibrio aminophilus]
MAAMKTLFQTLARYNAWANARLYVELTPLSPEQLAEALDVNFGSILGILNHGLLGDQLWLNRFTGRGPTPASIAEVVHPDLPGLTAARVAEDENIIRFADSLNPGDELRVLSYTSTEGIAFAEPMALLLSHFFNHQTHHRGQVHALLGRFGVRPRDLDLVFFQKETGTYPG